MLTDLECNNIAYADDTTIYVIIPKPADRSSCSRRLIADLIFINDWCKQWGMLLNPGKTKSMIFSRSRTFHPAHPNLTLEDTIIENVDLMKLLGVTFDSKLSYEYHLRNITSHVSQNIGILRKCWRVYQDDALVKKCFFRIYHPTLRVLLNGLDVGSVNSPEYTAKGVQLN